MVQADFTVNTNTDLFAEIMRGLDAEFQVRHIATVGLVKCDCNANVVEHLNQYAEYDQFPVTEGGQIIGLLECPQGEITWKGLARKHMQPLTEDRLVGAQQPLLQFLDMMREPPYYRYMVSGATIAGIVTRSDVHKLPVRTLAFALVSHLESVLLKLIDSRFEHDDQWLALLDNRQQNKIRGRQRRLQADRIDPSLVELTEMWDKQVILSETSILSETQNNRMTGVRDLRNQVAHGRGYADNQERLEKFIQRLQDAQQLIYELSELLPSQITPLIIAS